MPCGFESCAFEAVFFSRFYDTNGFGTDIRPILSDSAAICQGVWRACTMAGLFKEKNAWHIRFYLRGKPCRKSPGPITERKARRAKQKVEARLADLKAGFLRIPENADLAEHLRSWPRRRSLVCGGDRTSRGSGSIACGTPSPAASARRASISDSLTTTWSIRRRGCAMTTFPQSRDRRTVWRALRSAYTATPPPLKKGSGYFFEKSRKHGEHGENRCYPKK